MTRRRRPRPGEIVRATVKATSIEHGKVVVGRIEARKSNPRKPETLTRWKGHRRVMIRCVDGKRRSVPWTLDTGIVEFQVIGKVR